MIDVQPRVLLLDQISGEADAVFEKGGYSVDHYDKSRTPEDLAVDMDGYSVLGVRSGPEVTPDLIVPSLDVVAVFGNGTNHITRKTVDKTGLDDKGGALINASVENTRAVAELVMAFTLGLARHFPLHAKMSAQDLWSKKVGKEIRGQTLGVVGYGAIGSQVSVLAEALNMDVVAHDLYTSNVPQGRTVMMPTLEELLEVSDFVTLNTPLTKETHGMINRRTIKHMQHGAFLINAARAPLHDNRGVFPGLRSEQLAGFGVDVYPADGTAFGKRFRNPYTNVPNVLQTPHIGGNTEQAQATIGSRVASSVLTYLETGDSRGTLNIPHLALGNVAKGTSRIVNVHDNEPGASQASHQIIAEAGLNIVDGAIKSPPGHEIGYESIDVEGTFPKDVVIAIQSLQTTRRARVIANA